tara:strand:+ start:4645 stop:4926 length:282 start_codon:yes stop_codon:yes gene_type:complete
MKSEKFKDPLDENPKNEFFRLAIGKSFMDEGNPNEGISLCEKYQRQKPDWMMPPIFKTECHIALERMEEARFELNRTVKLAIEQEHEASEAEI